MKKVASPLPFGVQNYLLLLLSIAALGLGFGLIALDGEVHGFGIWGLTIGPIVVVMGFGIAFWAILHSGKEEG